MRQLRWQTSLLLLLTGWTARAQDLTLDQLVDRALKNNLSVQTARLDEAGTEARIREVKAGALPQVNLSGDYRRYAKIPGQVVPASIFGGPEGSYQTLAFGLPYNLSTTIQASQVLYNPSVGLGLKAARIGQDAASLQTLKTKEDVAYNVTATYYNLQATVQQMTFLRSNLESVDRLIRITELLRQNQLAQGIDVNRLQISRTTSATQIESVQANYNQLLNLLKYLTGTPQSDSLRVQVTLPESAPAPLHSQAETAGRTDLLLLDRQKLLNEIGQRNVRAGFIPTVAAYGVANSTFFGIGGENGILKNVPGYWFGLQLNWNLFDGLARKSRLQQQRIENGKITLQQQQVRESMAMEITNARNRFLVEQQNLAAGRDQVTLAEKVYGRAQLQFKEGMVSLTEIIQAENSLREAQNNYLNTLIRLRTAELDWKKATGTLVANS
ncbi:TolC family protein [Larkinella soli]|uniref:TolC family protein n=1 Tax=Larkinella soli TaxID=1770527 RepID=UPI000FFC862E|nr:TolC family protein [Larkinella soli]